MKPAASVLVRAGSGISFSIEADFDSTIDAVIANVAFMTDNIVLRVSKVLANELRAGKSHWRVRTGYSRSRFVGHRDGVHNDASYAPYLEARYRDGREYVEQRLAGAVRDILEKRSQSVRRRVVRSTRQRIVRGARRSLRRR